MFRQLDEVCTKNIRTMIGFLKGLETRTVNVATVYDGTSILAIWPD
jgi:hypothetical protein